MLKNPKLANFQKLKNLWKICKGKKTGKKILFNTERSILLWNIKGYY